VLPATFPRLVSSEEGRSGRLRVRRQGMKRVRMFGVVVLGAMLALAFARPMEASPQAADSVGHAPEVEVATRS